MKQDNETIQSKVTVSVSLVKKMISNWIPKDAKFGDDEVVKKPIALYSGKGKEESSQSVQDKKLAAKILGLENKKK
ncbi:hypothetical protein HDU92_002600 [Lobulomyces angularis]|nr:hypothetical protein HDU92_002600 [Lobulomyces angularis]